MSRALVLAMMSTAGLLAACDQQSAPRAAATPPASAQPVHVDAPPAPGSPAFTAAAVNAAAFAPNATETPDRSPALLRAQVLLDRAKFSPGVIDGRPGENVRQALAAYEQANGLPADGKLEQAVFDKLTRTDTRPTLKPYVISADDVKGPFLPIPKDMTGQSRMQRLGYETAREGLAEKFHMTEELLAQLNPNVDFNTAGQTITVADVGDDILPAKVGRIEVDKAESAVRAYDDKGALLAFYPATIGSEERPAPSGDLKVANVTHNPNYVFDPARLTFKAKGVTKKTTLPPGPNNPVGSVWIGLSLATYGIHGAPEPKEIGKRFSHGCVRLTNWDADELASGAKAGIKVSFLGDAPGGLRGHARAKDDAKAGGGKAKAR